MARTILAIALASAYLGLSAAGPEIPEDAPLAGAPRSGDVTGTIGPLSRVAAVEAVSRATGKRYPAEFDRATGRFAVKDLPGDAAYDVCIRTGDGASIEGIDLSWHEARLLRLAALRREQLQLPPERARAFTRQDADELLGYVRDLKDFTDLRRVLYLSGDGLRATLLVEAMRTSDFYDRRGDEVIWRVELWYFRFARGGWQRVPNVERTLRRERIAYEPWRRITVAYYPELSVRVDEQGRSRPVAFTIPDRLDISRGRLAGTELKQETIPYILALEGATTTSTGPAESRRPH